MPLKNPAARLYIIIIIREKNVDEMNVFGHGKITSRPWKSHEKLKVKICTNLEEIIRVKTRLNQTRTKPETNKDHTRSKPDLNHKL